MITTTSLAVVLALISTVLGSIGSLMFKLSANTLTTLKEALKQKFLIRFIIGAIVFVISVIIYTFALSLVELSFLFPFVALSYIWTNFLNRLRIRSASRMCHLPPGKEDCGANTIKLFW